MKDELTTADAYQLVNLQAELEYGRENRKEDSFNNEQLLIAYGDVMYDLGGVMHAPGRLRTLLQKRRELMRAEILFRMGRGCA
jgi:hypothetical protein